MPPAAGAGRPAGRDAPPGPLDGRQLCWRNPLFRRRVRSFGHLLKSGTLRLRGSSSPCPGDMGMNPLECSRAGACLRCHVPHLRRLEASSLSSIVSCVQERGGRRTPLMSPGQAFFPFTAFFHFCFQLDGHPAPDRAWPAGRSVVTGQPGLPGNFPDNVSPLFIF